MFDSEGRGKTVNPAHQVFVDFEVDGSDYIVKVQGELDIYTAPIFETALSDAVSGAKGKHIIVDLSQCRYIDSRAISVLIGARKKSGSKMSLVVLEDAMIRRVFDIVKIDTIIPVTRSIEEARAGGLQDA